MLDTDTTYGITSRPSAFGDLRFAGTIAAGLVAGTLGLGALAAPLVGWKDWPSALGNDASAPTLKLAGTTPTGAPGKSRDGKPDGGSGNQGPNSAAPLRVNLPGTGATGATNVGLPGLTGALGATGGTGVSAPSASKPKADKPEVPFN